MKESYLKNQLQQRFSFENWKVILPSLFNKVDYFTYAENLFTENGKVIDGKQIGTVKLDDGKQLAIFTIEVANNISIVRNRQGLREIASQHIDQNIIHGALAFFYNKNQADYRFSFITREASIDNETGELIKIETKPKRYTYLLGSNESCTTSAKRLMVLADKKDKEAVDIKQLKEVFSVEALNKDFFKTYKAHYEKFWKYLASDESTYRSLLIDNDKVKKEEQEKPIRDFVKKLLGRIVFLHFLQKKGWLGCEATSQDWKNGEGKFMQLLFENFSNKDKFNSQCLSKLFFNTLNTKRENDIFSIKGLNGKIDGSRVPYLNGGLFEPDQNESELKIDFPNDYFKELLEFFEQYNFTIDENSPDDHEVGIDPEMLGHIFENLLEENREKGAFYTPKEIVQYMCKEGLIQYLSNCEFGNLLISEQRNRAIEEFVRTHVVDINLAKKEIAEILDKKLDDIKVCDPAIGSGAFPIGILQEIFEAKRFIYPYLKTNKPFNPAIVKKNIIQNSIYGIDIEKGAVDIAQLRFWLALVVEEENPHPLPNLDYKIMQGNSLLEKFEDIDLSHVGKLKKDVRLIEPERDLFGNIKENQMSLTFSQSNITEKIQSHIQEYFTIENSQKKHQIRMAINNLVLEHIEFNIELRENQLRRWISEAGNPDKITGLNKKKYHNWIVDLDKLKITKTQLLKIQQTDERPYFLWHLYFMDVFQNGGFDLIIGNPPYIQLQKDGGKLAKQYADSGYETYEKSGDIYSLFYEKGFEVLKNKAHLIYITSNKWMRAGYGESSRRFFAEKTNPVLLIDFAGQKIFESATVDTNILLLSKEKNHNNTKACIVKEKVLNNLSVYIRQNMSLCKFNSSDSWGILTSLESQIKTKIELLGVPLKDWEINIYRGILTGYNEAFIITKEKKEELIDIDPKSVEIIRPILRGRDIKRYGYEFGDLWLINMHNGIKESGLKPVKIDDYPAIKQHLDEHYTDLEKRSDKGDTPYNLRNCAYMEDFFKQKLLWAETMRIHKNTSNKFPRFGFDNGGELLTDKTCFFATGPNIKYIMAILNSTLGRYLCSQYVSILDDGGYLMQKIYLEKIPIPTEIPKVSELTDQLLIEENSAKINRIEEEIDSLIFSAFQLAPEEISFIHSTLQ